MRTVKSPNHTKFLPISRNENGSGILCRQLDLDPLAHFKTPAHMPHVELMTFDLASGAASRRRMSPVVGDFPQIPAHLVGACLESFRPQIPPHLAGACIESFPPVSLLLSSPISANSKGKCLLASCVSGQQKASLSGHALSYSLLTPVS